MSTKIYTGFEFVGENDIRSIHKNIRDFQVELEPVVNKMICSFIVRTAVAYHDDVVYLGHKVNSGRVEPIWNAIQEFNDRENEIKKTRRRDPEVDFEFEITVHPIKDKVLGMHFTEQREFQKLLSEKPWFKEYGYWNNSDPLDGCLEEDWDKRRDDWEEALPDYSPAGFVGFSLKLTNPNCYSAFSNVRDDENLFYSFVPSKNHRAKKIVEISMRKEYFDRENIDFEELKKKDGYVSELMNHIYTFNGLINSSLKNEYDNRVAEQEKNILNLNYEILTKPLEVVNTTG